jgi:hypothetical protein
MAEVIHLLPGIGVSYDRDQAIKAAHHLLLAYQALHGLGSLSDAHLDQVASLLAGLLGDDDEIALAGDLVNAALEAWPNA